MNYWIKGIGGHEDNPARGEAHQGDPVHGGLPEHGGGRTPREVPRPLRQDDARRLRARHGRGRGRDPEEIGEGGEGPGEDGLKGENIF